MIKHIFITLCMLTTLPYNTIVGMATTSQMSFQERDEFATNQKEIALANRAAFSGSLSALKTIFDQNPDSVLQKPAECFSPTSYRAIFSQSSPQLLGTPLLFAVLSARQPVEKINFLKEHGLTLEPLICVSNNSSELSFKPLDKKSRQDPFWTAVNRHEREKSALSHSIIIALIKNYPETMLSRDHKGETVLIRAARNLDTALIADLLYETNYNAQLIDAPVESPLTTPAELMQQTPDAKRVVTPAKRMQTALDISRMATYTPPSNVIARFFNSQDLFEERKQACISLLEAAENKVKSRAQDDVESHQHEAQVKGLYPETKKER